MYLFSIFNVKILFSCPIRWNSWFVNEIAARATFSPAGAGETTCSDNFDRSRPEESEIFQFFD